MTRTQSERVAIYARTASNDTLSLARQIEQCESYAQQHGFDVVTRLTALATSDDDRLVDLIESEEIDVVLAIDVTRLARSMRRVFELVDCMSNYQVRFVGVLDGTDTDSESTRYQLRMLDALARCEAEQHSKRTRQGIARARAAREAGK